MTSQKPVSDGSSFVQFISWILLLAGLLFFLFSLIVYGLGEPYSSLGFVHPMRMRPPFADLRMLTANAECGVNLDAYYKGLVVGCDPAGRTYRFDYPPMSIWLGRWLHVRGSHTPWIGVTTSLAMVASILGLVRAQLLPPWKWRLLAAALLMAFPVLQCVERGNIDTMIFLMMLLLAYLLSRPKRDMLAALPSSLLAGWLTFLSVSLKIFPLFGIAGLALCNHQGEHFGKRIQWGSWLTKGVVLFSAAAGVIPLISYFRTVGNLIKEGGLGSFGLMAFGYMNPILIDAFGGDLARLLIRLLYVSKAAALLLGIVMAYRTGLAQAPTIGGRTGGDRLSSFYQLNLVIMSSIWMGSYIFTINYDYRFIFLIPFVVYLAALVSSASGRRIQAGWIVVVIIAFLLVCFLPWLRLNYTALGMASVRLLEPVTEFVLIPIIAGTLFCFLASKVLFFLPSLRPVGNRF